MPRREEHCRHSFERYSVRGEDIHRWIDEPAGIPTKTSHRNFRHDLRCLPVIKEVFKNKYNPEIIENILIDHIKLDIQSKEFKREENVKRGSRKALCKWCNKEFYIDECHRVFCSQECHTEWIKKKATILITIACQNCKKKFTVHGGSMVRRFCSKLCHNEWREKVKIENERRRIFERRRRQWKHRCNIHKCPVCEKTFVPHPSRQRCCSQECGDLYEKSYKREGICKRCGKEFFYVGKPARPRRFCSQKCYSLSISEGGKEQATFNYLSKTLAAYIIKLRETNRQTYLECLKVAHEEFGDEWYAKFNRSISKFNIKTRGVGFRCNEPRKGDGGRFVFDTEHGHTRGISNYDRFGDNLPIPTYHINGKYGLIPIYALAIPQTTALATCHPPKSNYPV